MWYSSRMKRFVVLPITALTLIAVSSAAYMVYGSQTVEPGAKQAILSTKQTANTAPAPTAVEPTAPSPAPDTKPSVKVTNPSPAPTATTLFTDSSSNYAPGAVVTTNSVNISGPWTMDYSYSCDGSKGVIIMFHNAAVGGDFSAGNQGSSYTASLPIAGPSYGTFRVVPPDGETCTWS